MITKEQEEKLKDLKKDFEELCMKYNVPMHLIVFESNILSEAIYHEEEVKPEIIIEASISIYNKDNFLSDRIAETKFINDVDGKLKGFFEGSF